MPVPLVKRRKAIFLLLFQILQTNLNFPGLPGAHWKVMRNVQGPLALPTTAFGPWATKAESLAKRSFSSTVGRGGVLSAGA